MIRVGVIFLHKELYMESVGEKYSITVTDRKILTMGGVNDIRGFDDEGIVLETELGRVHVEGNDLKIESLSREGGNILIKGDIEAVYFSDTPVKKRSFFGK
jgi:sporulation protein YabP